MVHTKHIKHSTRTKKEGQGPSFMRAVARPSAHYKGAQGHAKAHGKQTSSMRRRGELRQKVGHGCRVVHGGAGHVGRQGVLKPLSQSPTEHRAQEEPSADPKARKKQRFHDWKGSSR